MKKKRKAAAAAAETAAPEAEAAPEAKKRKTAAAPDAGAQEKPAAAEGAPRAKKLVKKKKKAAQVALEAAPAPAPAPAPAKRRADAEGEAAAGAGPPPSKPKSGKRSAKKRKAAERAEAPAPKEAAPPPPKKEPSDNTDCTVFVDGVPYQWTVDKIEEFFSSCGKVVEVKAPTWQDSGRLRGFAHVTFSSPAEMKKAWAMDGTKVGAKSRYLKIEAAKKVEQVAVPKAEDLAGYRRLFVKNLPYDVTEAEIIDTFKQFGKVEDVRVATSFGRCKGFAYVDFAKSASLQKAVTTQPWPELKGRALKLDADTGSGPKAGFHYRSEAYSAMGTGGSPGRGRGGQGRGGGRGEKGGSRGGGRGGRGGKLSLF